MLKEYLGLQKYVKFYWRYFSLGIIFLIFYGLANGVSLSSIVPLMDRILAGKFILLPESLPIFVRVRLENLLHFLNRLPALTVLKGLIVFIVSVMFLKGVFYYLSNYYLQRFGNRILTDLRSSLYRKLVSLSLIFFSGERTGELTTRIIYDVNVLNTAFAIELPHLLLKGIESLVYLGIILSINWRLSLVSFVIFPFLLWPVFRVTRKLRKLSQTVQENYARIGQVIQETVYGQPVIKAYNQEDTFLRRFHQENEGIFRATMAIIRRTIAIMPFTEIV
ncbi:MAG: ABC transporter transmembrane domain-containing protein, partial [Candidatus Omnitrophica bacterium]|nr:ABC transporter transmembrane domain-containing protein [Candidatus Omnitrophota bacterium]